MIQEDHLLNLNPPTPVNQKVSLIQSLLGNLKSMISQVTGSKKQIEIAKQIEKNEPISNAIENLTLPILKKSISDPIAPAKGDIQEIKDFTIYIEPNSVNFPMKKEYKKDQICAICYSQIKDIPHLVNYCCQPTHLHPNCVFEYIKQSAETVFKPIICPVGCERHTKVSEIQQICGLVQKIVPELKQTKEIARYISHNKILSDPKNLFICPYANCLGVISRATTSQQELVKCPECKNEICLNCDRIAHKGSDCMKFLQEEKVKLDDKFDEEVKSRKYQTCPGCIKVISRVDGCRCMSCICGVQFCYWCGKFLDWDYPEGDQYCRCNDDEMEELDPEYYQ